MVFASGRRTFLQLKSLSQMAESVTMKSLCSLFTRRFPPNASIVRALLGLACCLFASALSSGF
jgi:hypothetical protein